MPAAPFDHDPLHSFARLPQEVEKRLRSLLRVRTFQAGEAIYLQGEPPEAIYLVASGRVKIVRVTPEGYENILCLRGPGEYFCPVPLLDQGLQLGTAFAITDVTLLQASQAEFIQLCQESPALLSVVQGDCLAEVRHLLNRLEAFAFRSIRERLALVLLDAVRRQPKGDQDRPAPLEVRLTQQDLAGLVGGTRESVSRNLQELERLGAITLGRGRVLIRNLERLQQVAVGKTASTP